MWLFEWFHILFNWNDGWREGVACASSVCGQVLPPSISGMVWWTPSYIWTSYSFGQNPKMGTNNPTKKFHTQNALVESSNFEWNLPKFSILHLMFSDGVQKTSCVCISGWNRALSSERPSIFVCPLTRRLTQASQLIRQIQKTVVNKSKSHETNGHWRRISSDSHSMLEGTATTWKRWTDSLFPYSLTFSLQQSLKMYKYVWMGCHVYTKYSECTIIFLSLFHGLKNGSTKIMNRIEGDTCLSICLTDLPHALHFPVTPNLNMFD